MMRYVRKGAGVLRHFGQQSASSPNRSMVTTVESMVAGQKTTHDLYSRLRSQRSHLNLTFPREGGYPPRATVSQPLTNHCSVISCCGRERNLRNSVTGAKFPAHFRLIFAATIVIVSQHKMAQVWRRWTQQTHPLLRVNKTGPWVHKRDDTASGAEEPFPRTLYPPELSALPHSGPAPAQQCSARRTPVRHAHGAAHVGDDLAHLS